MTLSNLPGMQRGAEGDFHPTRTLYQMQERSLNLSGQKKYVWFLLHRFARGGSVGRIFILFYIIIFSQRQIFRPKFLPPPKYGYFSFLPCFFRSDILQIHGIGSAYIFEFLYLRPKSKKMSRKQLTLLAPGSTRTY